MKTVLKIEEALMLALAIYLNTNLSYAGWLYWAFFLVQISDFSDT